MKTTIYSCFHKEYIIPNNIIIKPIQVGKEIADNNLNILADNEGENISEKNPNYCELTALYWIWKNSDSDIVGLCHYRRYLNFKNKIQIAKSKNISKYDIDKYNDFKPEKIEKYFKNGYDVILPKANRFRITVYDHYCKCHKKEDIDELIKIIAKIYPEYKDAVDKVFNNKKMHICNMIICKKSVLDSYCEWLFKILSEVEKVIKIDNDQYQSRVFGFMSERLLNVYIEKNKLRKKEMQMLFVEE